MLRVATSKTFLSIISLVFFSGLACAATVPPLPEPDAQTVWPGSPRDRVGFEFDAQQFLWDDLKTSLTEAVIGGEVNVLTPDDSGIFVGGEFTTTSEVAANNIAHWNGANWTALGSGLNGPVHTIALMNDDVYVGGDFTEAGGQAAN